MKKLKLFGNVFWRSLTDFSYYKEIAAARFWFSFKYLYFLLFLTSLVGGLLFARDIVSLVPQIPSFTNRVSSAAKKLFPEELVVTIKNNKISTNVNEPYFISFPDEFGKLEGYDYLLVIDTKASVEDYKKYNSVVLFTDDTFVTPDDRSSNRDMGAYQVYPLEENLAKVPDGFSFDRNAYDRIVESATPYLNYLPTIAYVLIGFSILVFPFISASSNIVGKLIYLLPTALLVLLIARLMKKIYSYGDLYRMSMHGLTLPILISFVIGLFGFVVPFWVSPLVLLVFMAVVLFKN